MAGQTDRAHVRLAELVAALSLGVDLGFGQPMEHVLRQCLIALRLAERLGLDDQARAVVYYTALLVNVGCHSDAHEQAKWFGDDIAAKSTQVRLSAAQPAGDSREHANARCREPAAPSLPRRARVHARRPSRDGRHDHSPRRDGAAARASSLRFQTTCSTRSPRRTSSGTDAAGRARSAGRPCRSRRGSRSSRSTPRSRTGSEESGRSKSSPANGAASSSTLRPPRSCAASPTCSSPASTRSRPGTR